MLPITKEKKESSLSLLKQAQIMFTVMHLEIKVNSFKGVNALQV